MTDQTTPWADAGAAFSVESIARQFEQALETGSGPRIEDFLARTPADSRPAALGELLRIEIALRRKRGDTVQRNDYRQRFPSSVELLDELGVAASIDLNETIAPPSADTVYETAVTSARYTGLRLFCRGGLGALYRAVDESLQRETVVKFMNDKSEHDPTLVAQFRVEAEVTSRLDHPGVVPVYGVGHDKSGRPFYVMRLINGRELRQAIQEHHAGGESKRSGREHRQQLFGLLEHLTSACNTIAYAHDVGIVHCDIKPANIMIGKYGETFVLDWGLATPFDRGGTFSTPRETSLRPRSSPGGSNSGLRGGTYGYVSPEQLCTNDPVSPASDVYSLGATLYEILTGDPPFNGKDPDVIDKIRTGQFKPPRSQNKRIPRGLEGICLKALSLSPQARYATAKQLAADLTNWMHDEETQACPDGWSDRILRTARRHRAAAAAVVVTLFTILIAGAWTERMLRVAGHEKELREKSDELRLFEQKALEAEKISFTTALDTFEDLCRPFANGELNNLGVTRPFVDKIKNFTAVYLENFEKSESMRLHTGRVYELRATVSYASSDMAEALDDYQRAEKLYTELTSTEVDRFEHALRLAQVHVNQGRLFVQSEELDDAGRVLEAAASSLERLRKQEPENTVVRRHLAEAYHCLGEVHLNRTPEGADRHQALEDSQLNFEKSKRLREELVNAAEGDERRDLVRDLARSLGYLGDLHVCQGDIPQAEKNYQQSKSLREGLYRKNPINPENRFQFARGLCNFGYLERDYRGNLSHALEELAQAREIQEKLAAEFPEVLNCLLDLADTQNLLAEIYLLDAQAEPTRAVEMRKLCRTAAEQAGNSYGRAVRAGGGARPNPRGVHGLASSYATLAALEQAENPSESLRLAKEAERLMLTLGPEPMLLKYQLVTLAMARALQGAPEQAFKVLKEAIERGENTAFRFERHGDVAFRSITAQPELRGEFDALCKKVRSSLKFD